MLVGAGCLQVMGHSNPLQMFFSVFMLGSSMWFNLSSFNLHSQIIPSKARVCLTFGLVLKCLCQCEGKSGLRVLDSVCLSLDQALSEETSLDPKALEGILYSVIPSLLALPFPQTLPSNTLLLSDPYSVFPSLQQDFFSWLFCSCLYL